MSSEIICPKCNHRFAPTDAFKEEVQKELNIKAQEWQRKKEEEYKQKEQQTITQIQQLQQQIQVKEADAKQQQTLLQQQLQAQFENDKKKFQQQLEENLKKQIASDFETQLQFAQQLVKTNEEKLQQAQLKELEFLKNAQVLETKIREVEIEQQRQIAIERERIKEQITKDENERSKLKEQEFELRLKEKDKMLDDQKKLVDEMKRKAEQGSMQMQGEIQEILLEELLAKTFPFDVISEVGKGIRGADCVQTVRTKLGATAGTIMYESKRTKDFSNEWIEKLKANMRSQAADIAVIVTQTLPKDFERFGEKDGVYICTFSEVRSVALLLRNALLKVYEVKKANDNKGDKMSMLYDYLIGNEFGEQWKAISEGFRSMQQSIAVERAAMEKLWKAREKQLEKILLNAAHLKGSIEGIAGADINVDLLGNLDETKLIH